ncbi:MAG: hypothetical protein JWN40_4879 [Phycisphaerales bacterium]|nr:hypothetical protein [Phycisphaerales bacterium]
MQGLLVLVFAAAVGLAALVTRHVRMSMRVELGDQRSIGRLVVRMPAKWLSSPAVVEKGDGVEAEEPPSEVQAGRRLRVIRQKSDGLVSPLQHLVRSGHIKGDVIKALAEGREGFSISNLSIGGWPGQMVTTWSSPRAGVVHKDVVACAMLPSSQALVIQLQGLGPLDASDKELVRQMSENVALAMQDPAIAAAAGGVIELLDEIKVEAPAHYVLVPNNDPNQLQRQLLFDGSRGSGWVAVDLTSCVFFADDGEEAFLTMLAGRDPEWRSGPVKHLGLRTLMVDRTEAAGQGFPARGYLTANSDGRALLVVMRGGPGDQRMFDSAWQGIASSVRFAGTRDLSALLVNGAEASRAVAAGEALARLSGGGESGALDWWMWDESENADKELWSQMKWQLTRKGDDVQMSGTRTSRPMAYATDTQFAQQWSASGDLSRYQITTSREVRRAGNSMSRPKLEQQVSVERGRMTLASVLGQSQVDVAAPGRYVPGALLPLVVQELAERPSLVKTESFVGVETLAPPGLLTLFVTRLNDSPVRLDEDDKPMDCVTVSVNGTGMASRWYYSADHELRFIDFAGGLKAQSGVGK